MHGSIGLLSIDFNKDFLGDDAGESFSERHRDGRVEKAALAVRYGVRCAEHTTRLIATHGERFDSIDYSEDDHVKGHSATGLLWRDLVGNRPIEFGVLPADGVRDREWLFGSGNLRTQAREYVLAMQAAGKPHRIWPEHCVRDTWGQQTYTPLIIAIRSWEMKTGKSSTLTKKGSALIPEHFGIYEAEIQDANDPSTQTNWVLLNRLNKLDRIVITGLALDICVKRSIEQMIDHLGVEVVRKLIILTDCTAAIDEAAGKAFLESLRALGATITTSDKIFA